jgi:hypothetical protein
LRVELNLTDFILVALQ